MLRSSLSGSERQDEAHRGVELGLLDRLGGVDALRAHDRAFTDEAAFPDPLGVRDDGQPLRQALVARIEVVAPREGGRCRAEKFVVKSVDGAGRVAKHAVDAFAELPELVDLVVGLTMLAAPQRNLLLADDTG